MTDRTIWPERGAKPEKNGGLRMICPHCGQDATIRTSRWLTRLTKEAYAQCQNVKCFHAWKIIASGTDTVVPPLTPNPDVYLHPSTRARTGADDNDKQLSLPGIRDPMSGIKTHPLSNSPPEGERAISAPLPLAGEGRG